MSLFPARRPAEILLVEDNEGDIRLAQEAWREAGVKANLHVAKDGVAALEFLRRKGTSSTESLPDLILLDLNLPRMDGRQVLAEIKQDAALRRIPTVVLSTSKADEDVLKAYDLHVNCYITKPFDMDVFVDVVKAIDNFWLTVVTPPQHAA